MQKDGETDRDELLPEYDLRSLRIRKLGPSRMTFPTHGVFSEPDVASIFPDSNSVDEALRFLMRFARNGESTLPTNRPINVPINSKS